MIVARRCCALATASMASDRTQRKRSLQTSVPVHRPCIQQTPAFGTCRKACCQEEPPSILTDNAQILLTPEEYMERLRKGDRLPTGQRLSGLIGRVMWGQTAGDFKWLGTYNGDRVPWTFAIGSDGLQEIIGKDTLQILLTVGFEPLYIHRRLQDGFSFALAVCRAEDVESFPATWDGWEHCFRSYYAVGGRNQKIIDVVCKHLPAIKQRTFSDLERVYDNNNHSDGAMRAAMRDPSHQAHMSEKKLAQLDTNAKPEDVRAFLLHHWNLAPLFKGTGKICGTDEIQACDEVFVCNVELSKVEHALTPLGTPPMDIMVEKLRDRCSIFQDKLADMPPKVHSVSPREYMYLLHDGKPLKPNVELQGVCGRIICGTSPTHYNFKTIGGFFAGPDGLAALLGKQPMDMLLMCGFDELDIYDKVQQGSSFGLVVLPLRDSGAVEATWDGFDKLIATKYPSISQTVTAHLPSLRTRRFADLDAEFQKENDGMSMSAAAAIYDKKMTIERLESLGDQASPSDVRALLYHQFGCNNLFRGDGYTMSASGALGFKEYVVYPRRARKELDDLGAVYTVLGTPPRDKCIEKVCQRYGILLEKLDMFGML